MEATEISNYEKLRNVIHSSLLETSEKLIENISNEFNISKEDITIETVNGSLSYGITIKQPVRDARIVIMGDIQ